MYEIVRFPLRPSSGWGLSSFLVELAGEPFVLRGLAHLVGTYKMCNRTSNEQFGLQFSNEFLPLTKLNLELTQTLIRLLMKILTFTTARLYFQVNTYVNFADTVLVLQNTYQYFDYIYTRKIFPIRSEWQKKVENENSMVLTLCL